MIDYLMVKCKLREPRIGRGYTFSERNEFYGFFIDPLNSLPGLYHEVEHWTYAAIPKKVVIVNIRY